MCRERLVRHSLLFIALVAGVCGCGGGGTSAVPSAAGAGSGFAGGGASGGGASGGGGSGFTIGGALSGGGTVAAAGAAGKIAHVVILIQENRTLDNLFNGFPGADTVPTGTNSKGQTIALAPTPFEGPYDPDHEHSAWVSDYDGGKMDGFDVPAVSSVGPLPVPPNYAYGYVPQAETVPYWTLASQFTLADRNFAAEQGPSYPGHQYLIAGQSDFAIGNPNDALMRWGCDAAVGTTTPVLQSDGTVNPNGPFPCFDYQTLADLLDQKNVLWRYYTELYEKTTGIGVQPYDAIRHIRYGADWANVVTPQTNIFTDIASGNLAAVSWVNPPLVASDHAQDATNLGPDWIGSIVNAIGSSPYWNSTAIFIVWDDWGGWYDHVAPQLLDRMGLSFRVPLLVVSPYAKHGYVSHVQHEPGSILKFTEEVFGLGSLGTTDVRADDLADCFDFTQPQKPLVTIKVKTNVSAFVALPPDTKPIDY